MLLITKGYNTREDWLMDMLDVLKKDFANNGYPITTKKIRISCGFPKGKKGSKGKAIGEVYPPVMSEDGTAEIFISPEIQDPIRVLDILIHELCHVQAGNEAGHKKPFKQVALKMGLTGKMTETIASEKLSCKLRYYVYKTGNYPHASLHAINIKTQSTRLIKAQCPICEYTIRIARKWIEEAGLPDCPSCLERLKEL